MAKALLAVDPATMQNLIQDSLMSAAEMDVDSENGKGEAQKAEEKRQEPMDIPPEDHNSNKQHPQGESGNK